MTDKNYHHGDLHTALVKGARAILERDGLAALTLRACAREVGVSHAAPLHHFKNLAELLAAVAASGFDDFVKALAHGSRLSSDPLVCLADMGFAYVGFAAANPALFRVMFGSEVPHIQTPALAEAMRAAWNQLYFTALAAGGENNAVSDAALFWSVVHGHSMLVAARCMPPMIEPDVVLKSSFDTIAAGIRARSQKS